MFFIEPISDLKVDKMPRDLRTPAGIIGGVFIGNFATNTLVPKLVSASGMEGFLGAEMTENTQNVLKVLLPTAVGLGCYQLIENKDLKNISIGVAGSGLMNGANILLRKNLPALAPRVLTMQGLGSQNPGQRPKSVPQLEQVVNQIDSELSGGNRSLPMSSGGWNDNGWNSSPDAQYDIS